MCRFLPPMVQRALIAISVALRLVVAFPQLIQAQALPIITSYSAGANQTTLIIHGVNLGSAPGAVQLDNARMKVVSWNNSGVTVTLPPQAGPGPLTIATTAGLQANTTFAGIERGYYALSSNGAVTTSGSATNYGGLRAQTQQATAAAVALVPTANDRGYWILTRTGKVYNFGDATSFGPIKSAKPITAVALAVLPSGTGAYVLAQDGTVYPLGQAQNYGSPASPITATSMAVTANGQGYWILGAHGFVYAYGNAKRANKTFGVGATSHTPLLLPELRFRPGKVQSETGSQSGVAHRVSKATNATVEPSTNTAVSLVPTNSGQGYWILWQNGAIQTYGNAASFGQPTRTQMKGASALGLTLTPDQSGYNVVLSTGQVLAFGDAQAVSMIPGITALAMAAGPSNAPSLLSLVYGNFLSPTSPSYQTLVSESKTISAIIPTWYYLSQDAKTLSWSIGNTPMDARQVVELAHQKKVQVWPMFGTASVGPFQTPARITSTVNQILSVVRANHYDGVTIDFEPASDDGLSRVQVSQQYTDFVAQLGPALHAMGKILMVDVYANFTLRSPFRLTAIAPYVNYVNIMSYGEFDSFTDAGPTQGLTWDLMTYQSALTHGLTPQQIVMGLGPYGDYWCFNNHGINQDAVLGSDGYVTDTQVAELLHDYPGIVPIWDPVLGSEVFMTNAYVNSRGQWAINRYGQAVAPTQQLSVRNGQVFNPQVQNLQGLLNYILLRYAVDHHEPIPAYLNLVQNGLYDTATAQAVAQFQKDFAVVAAPGVYGYSTQVALQQLIDRWRIGQYQYWVGNTRALQNRVTNVALADRLAGVAIWRAPFETKNYWAMLQATAAIARLGSNSF
ncbi:MAG: hypothetical protein C7B45_13200 [Sulfobacillus acidophilus]|uniref:GH18 domain-containing protein n=1 Tax=Sulfobacillus acidophilus TaxID=53633 RepID=A0A2T2WF44_9FIRM|nr:MAG: hypothetical protein C7B45_13200 [Sulfobacillus acidophilus]